jgi:hypothetical protein
MNGPNKFERIILIIGVIGFVSFFGALPFGYGPLLVFGACGIGLYTFLLLINILIGIVRDVKSSIFSKGVRSENRISIVVGLIIIIGAAYVLIPAFYEWLSAGK